jgi:hypothetical protein
MITLQKEEEGEEKEEEKNAERRGILYLASILML